MKAVEVWVSGRVQGVGFRAFVESAAAELGVNGWVRNLPDGRVQAKFEGVEHAVDRAVDACRRGPSAARVDSVESRDTELAGLSGFTVRPTEGRS